MCSLDVRPKEVVRTAMSPDRRQLVVRPVERADRRQWEQLWRGYNDFYERAIPAAVTDVAWSRFFDAYEPMHALVGLLGVVSIIFGLYLIVAPGAGALALLWLIGIYALFTGAMYLALGFRLRTVANALAM